MLPKLLTTDLCSLKGNVDRCVFCIVKSFVFLLSAILTLFQHNLLIHHGQLCILCSLGSHPRSDDR